MGGAAQPRHLRGEQLGVAAVPAVGEDHDDRAAADPAAVLAVELGQRGADPRAARPVRHALGGARAARGRDRGPRARA